MPTTLGYAEPVDDEFAHETFPSKIGGQPRWLDPTQPLAADAVACDECTKPMALLMQLSAPDDKPEAFHRMLYVFACRNGVCHKAGASRCMRVFRAQLPETSPVYTERALSTASGDDGDDVEWVLSDHVQAAPTCAVCGLLGNKACSKCHTRRYCSRAHQVADWDAGHKAQCGSTAQPTADHAKKLGRMAFPEHVIVSEEEPAESDNDDDDDGEDTEQIQSDSMAVVPVTNERVEDSEVEVDPAFMQFQRRIQREPDQVLRYARSPGSDVCNPLFVSDANTPAHIDDCELCGEPRQFEFQIMPQMLNHLELDSMDPNSVDWGTLLVYSCPRSCPPREAFVREVLYRQNFSSHGIGQKYLRAYHGDETAFSAQFESLD
ncbi:hypothetical protein IWW50_006689, partial [Coemansia erecta]